VLVDAGGGKQILVGERVTGVGGCGWMWVDGLPSHLQDKIVKDLSNRRENDGVCVCQPRQKVL
jgi:hypothetical protein